MKISADREIQYVPKEHLVCMFCGRENLERGGVWHGGGEHLYHCVCPQCAPQLGKLFADTVADGYWYKGIGTCQDSLKSFEKEFWRSMYLNK